ncbi:hypothetical protein DBB34_08420 [Sphaerisporangium cinnabarinum]|nr:hypothetical protein DBB34_08420 [Sphaerisporangium cinnabarinum]
MLLAGLSAVAERRTSATEESSADPERSEGREPGTLLAGLSAVAERRTSATEESSADLER